MELELCNGPVEYHALVPKQTGPRVEVDEAWRVEDLDRWSRIRCPQCEWQPHRSSRWHCGECLQPEGLREGCGTVWNTFETRGRCPGCQHQWRWTSCLACHVWSLHDDWYVEEADE